MAKTKRPATPSPLERAERAVVRAAMGWFATLEPDTEAQREAASLRFDRLSIACWRVFRLQRERQKARRVGR